MQTSIARLRGTATAKVLFIVFLVLVLLVPMRMLEGLITERTARLDSARAEIAESWGRAQTVGGPMLVVPFRYTRTIDGQQMTFADELNVLPTSLSIRGRLDTATLRRGLYEVPVYTARLSIGGVLPPPSFDAAYEELDVLWSEATIALPIGDPRPLVEPLRLRLADGEADFEAAAPAMCSDWSIPAHRNASSLQHCAGSDPLQRLVVPFPALGLEPLTAMQSFSIDLTIRGTRQLRFLPLGDTTDVSLASSWVSPSFNGAFLPTRRDVSDQGFDAAWQVLGLGRGYPSTWHRSDGIAPLLEPSSFGVDLRMPVGIHEASLRAAKYGVLFLGLTFLVYFLFESFTAPRLHAIQYLAVGAANCLFFLLLLALGEHVGFGWAYLASAVASLMLIGGYSATVLGAAGRAWFVVAVLGSVYGFLFVALQAEDYALLFGALGLFGALAAFMGLTRRLDWYTVAFDERTYGNAQSMGAADRGTVEPDSPNRV